MAKLIKLTKGFFATVDDDDFEWLSEYNWFVTSNRKGGNHYAKSYDGGKVIRMHRLILGITDPEIIADHIDRNGLNNQRYNLRVATYHQNSFNRKGHPNSSSRFIGVSWNKRDENWIAQISVNKRHRWIGSFKTEKEAAAAYNKTAIELCGEFANINAI